MNKVRYKKEVITPTAWQIWHTYVLFEGNDYGKKRPVLVRETNGLFCTIMEITSKPPSHETDVPIDDLVTAGLGKESVVQVRKTRTIPKASLEEYRGFLSHSDRNRVKDAIRRIGY